MRPRGCAAPMHWALVGLLIAAILRLHAWCSCSCRPCYDGRHCHNRSSGCY